jgi:hypothetical protein
MIVPTCSTVYRMNQLLTLAGKAGKRVGTIVSFNFGRDVGAGPDLKRHLPSDVLLND